MAATTMERTKVPGVYKKGNRYVATWRWRGRQCKSSHRTLAEAREAKAQRQSGDKRPESKVQFEDYFDGWIESYAGRTSRGFSSTTRDEYRRPIKTHALPRWGAWKLADIEPGDVRELFGQMRSAGSSTPAIRKLRAALSALFSTAVDDGLLRANPVAGCRIPAAPEGDESGEPQAKALTRHELSMVLAAIPEGKRLFFEFLAHTGLRISEALGLTWAHVDLGEHPRIRVREQVYRGKRKRLKSKDGRRDIPVSPAMADRLLALRRDNYGEDRPVFASGIGTPLIPGKVRQPLKKAAKSVGLSWVTPHTLRHTCASLLFAEGRNVRQVQAWLGHADPAFTLRTYVHLMDEGVGDASFMDLAVRATPRATRPPQTAANGSTPATQEVTV